MHFNLVLLKRLPISQKFYLLTYRTNSVFELYSSEICSFFG